MSFVLLRLKYFLWKKIKKEEYEEQIMFNNNSVDNCKNNLKTLLKQSSVKKGCVKSKKTPKFVKKTTKLNSNL